jgi:hypothetical protein
MVGQPNKNQYFANGGVRISFHPEMVNKKFGVEIVYDSTTTQANKWLEQEENSEKLVKVVSSNNSETIDVKDALGG